MWVSCGSLAGCLRICCGLLAGLWWVACWACRGCPAPIQHLFVWRISRMLRRIALSGQVQHLFGTNPAPIWAPTNSNKRPTRSSNAQAHAPQESSDARARPCSSPATPNPTSPSQHCSAKAPGLVWRGDMSGMGLASWRLRRRFRKFGAGPRVARKATWGDDRNWGFTLGSHADEPKGEGMPYVTNPMKNCVRVW